MHIDVISFDIHRQKSCNQGLMYTALSRITSMDRMYLVGNYSKKAIKKNSFAITKISATSM